MEALTALARIGQADRSLDPVIERALAAGSDAADLLAAIEVVDRAIAAGTMTATRAAAVERRARGLPDLALQRMLAAE